MRHLLFPLSRTPASYRMPARPTLRAVWEILCFEWRLIAAITLVTVLIGAIYIKVTPFLYEANIQIVPGDFTTKSTNSATAGLATLLLNGPTTSDSVKRFVTVLNSPDMAIRLVQQNRDAVLGKPAPPGWFTRLFGGGGATKPHDFAKRVEKFEGALSNIQMTDDKRSLATHFTYRATSKEVARNFLKLAISQGDEALRQYNLLEIRYDDKYLNNTIATAQNVDVRMALAQKLVETQLRRMDAERSEYFSIRALGPVEVSEGPVWPRSKLILAGMMIIGLLVGCVTALVRIYARNGRDLAG